MANNKDFKVKNGIQPTVYNEGVGTVVSAVGSYVISGASYSGKSKNVSTENGNPQGLWMREDNGTDFYMLGTDANSGGDRIDQYLLSTAFDISTATAVASKTLDVSPQTGTDPTDLFFKSDGTKLYVCDQQNVYQYALTTAWDLSTASFETGKTAYIGGQETANQAVAFSSDGTRMFIVGSNQDNFCQYNLSTAWDVSTATYSGNSFSITETSTPASIRFNDDGTKVFIVERTAGTESILQYSMTTAYDASTMSYDSVFLTVANQEGNPNALAFGDNGTKIYVAGSTSDTVYQYTSGTTASLDLSTGAVFDYTPTSDVQVTVSNPADSGTVSSATLLLTGAEATGVGSTFSTTTYTGNGGTQTITNNIDLATDGGLVWVKWRSGSATAGTNTNHILVDSERGTSEFLESDTTNAATATAAISSFNTDGFTTGGALTDVDNSGDSYVSWTFKKQSSFFDVVTYTGDGTSSRTISHSLGTTVGSMFIKKTSTAGTDWAVYHRGVGNTDVGYLNETWTFATTSTMWNNTTPTSSVFTIGSHNMVNQSGETYVAYLFAHDTSPDGLIQCSSYTGTGGSGVSVNLGWEPQWVMIKRATGGTSNWHIWDSKRGIVNGGNDKILFPDVSSAENTTLNRLDVSSTGFEIPSGNNVTVDGSGETYIYVAIRGTSVPTITYDTDLQWSGGTAPTAPAEGETDVITISTRDGGTTYQAIQAIDGAK